MSPIVHTPLSMQANVEGWNATSANAGTGSLGTCCSEMDIWEANSDAAAFTPHPCTVNGQTECTGDDCTRDTGLCDADGCDFNSFRLGNDSFYGNGLTVDTSQPFTVVTQFFTDDNTTTGTLSEIRRIYVQNGVVIQNSNVNIPGIDPVNSITEDFCTEQKQVFGDTNYFDQHGGLAQMGEALGTGMVLALSIWDDYTASMLWLDSDYPTNKDATAPGVARGTCATTTGVPSQIESQSPGAQVVFSNIKWGDIGSTFSSSSTGTSAPPPPSGSSAGTAPTQPAGGTVAQWGQCGGTGYTGATTCASGFTCHVVNPCTSFSIRMSNRYANAFRRLLAVLLDDPRVAGLAAWFAAPVLGGWDFRNVPLAPFQKFSALVSVSLAWECMRRLLLPWPDER